MSHRLWACSALTALLLGCTATQGIDPVSRLELENLAHRRGVSLPEVVVPYHLTPEMVEWVHAKVPASVRDPGKKLYELSNALLDPDDFGLRYDRGHTATAEEVFATRLANCLAFTHLFVGMAREIGVPVFFLEVRDIESYKREGDLIVVSDHVAVGYGPDHDLRIIDFAADASGGYHRIHRVRDHRAIAMYYSNLGAEALRRGDAERALAWLRGAVAIDPYYAASWVNLGVALRRSGNLDGAEASYRQALELDLRSTSALQNLAALLQGLGRTEEALDLLALVDRPDNRNPYSYLTLADLSLRHGRAEEAGRLYRKAVRGGGDEDPDALAALGLWELQQGSRRRARRLLERATSLDAEAVRVRELRRRLEGVGS